MSMLRRGRVSVVIAVAFALAAGGIAYASIPGPNGVIQGCYAKSNGALRVLDTGQTCDAKKENPLRWNQQGLTGPKGATGAEGTTGTAGANGQNGLRGASGPTGPKGSTGPKGPTGAGVGSGNFIDMTTAHYVETDQTVEHGAVGNVTANCPSGEYAIGGYFAITTRGGAAATHSYVSAAGVLNTPPTGYYVAVFDDEPSFDSIAVQVTVSCAATG